MVINFPSSPSIDDVYLYNGVKYIYDGTKWISGGQTFNDLNYVLTSEGIDGLVDVDTSTVAPTNGQVLFYDSTAGKWEPDTVAPTNLSYTASTRVLASSTGTNATLPEVVASGDSGLITGADKTKLDSALQPGDIGSTVQAYDADNVVADVAPTFTATVQTTERTITAGAFDLSTGNHWTCGAITVPAPTNATAGTSGLIRITAGPVVWNTVFKFPGGTAPTIASFPAIVPFYVQDASNILMGNVAEGIA